MVIWCTCRKIWPLTRKYEKGKFGTWRHIANHIFDFVAFKVLSGTFSSLVSKWPLTQIKTASRRVKLAKIWDSETVTKHRVSLML